MTSRTLVAIGAHVIVPHAPSLDAPESATVAMWVKFRSAPNMWPTAPTGWVGLLAKLHSSILLGNCDDELAPLLRKA